MSSMDNWPTWATWLVVAVAFAASLVRAVRWRDQPARTSFIAPVAILVAASGALLAVPWLAVAGLVGIAVGFAMDRYFMWRADTYGSMGRRGRDRIGTDGPW